MVVIREGRRAEPRARRALQGAHETELEEDDYFHVRSQKQRITIFSYVTHCRWDFSIVVTHSKHPNSQLSVSHTVTPGQGGARLGVGQISDMAELRALWEQKKREMEALEREMESIQRQLGESQIPLPSVERPNVAVERPRARSYGRLSKSALPEGCHLNKADIQLQVTHAPRKKRENESARPSFVFMSK